MTQISINQITTSYVTIPSTDKINFQFMGNKVHSASKIERIYATFVSNVIEASDYFLKWHEIIWSENKDNFSDVMFFIKTADSQEELGTAIWDGPHFDGNISLNNSYGRYAQFCFILKKSSASSLNYPSVKNIDLLYYTSETASRLYTKSFNIGFTPKSVVLTYNAQTNDDAIIKFAISGLDTADVSYYQYIEPNKIVELDSISYLSDNIKVMMEMIGTSESQVIVNEFALMFSGDSAFRLNKIYTQSSSSTTSSSTSESSSSSIDSSSSSSSSSTSQSSTSSGSSWSD